MSRIETSSGGMNVEQRGSGRPLVLIHGFPLDHTMWKGQLSGLSDRYRVIAPDLRGFGKSDVTIEATTMEQYADDIAEMVEALGIDEPVGICGLSMGGYIAWQFFLRHRERLARLVLCDTRAVADTEDAARQRMRMAESVLMKGTDELADVMIPRLFAASTLKSNPSAVEATRAVIRGTDPVGVASALRGMAVRADFTPHLPSVKVRALLLCGEHDVISPAEEMRGIAAAMPQAEFIEIPDAGHMAPLENPATVNAAIRQALW